MKPWQLVAWLLLALAFVPASSSAQSAYTAKEVNLRAGPARGYPLVARLPQGIPVSVAGCVHDYRWCDVVAGRNRGWVYGGNLVYPWQGASVPVLTYGAVIGLGIVAFSVANYWDRHYVGRPWYRQRQIWINRAPPGYRPGGRPQPPPGYRPGGGHRPPQGHGPGHRPPPNYRPGGHPQPPPGYRPGGDHRPPQGHGPGHRPPPNYRPGGHPQPPPGYRPGGGHRPPQGHEPGGGPHRR